MQHHFKLRSSRLFVALLVLPYLAALLSLCFSPLPPLAGFVLAAALTYGTAHYLLRDARLASKLSCVAFRLEGRDDIVLMLRNGMHLPGRVAADSLVTPYMVILNVKLSEPSGRRSVRVLPDAMGADSFRRLRVALRWGNRSDQAGV